MNDVIIGPIFKLLIDPIVSASIFISEVFVAAGTAIYSMTLAGGTTILNYVEMISNTIAATGASVYNTIEMASNSLLAVITGAFDRISGVFFSNENGNE